METNNSQSAQGESSSMEAPSTDWRSQLQPDSRQRIVNKIMDTLKRHLPVVGPEGMGELQKIALRFEEKIYSAAVNQSDYLRRISMKMLSMETKTQQNTSMNSQPGFNQISTDTGLLGGPLQVNNQGQPLSQIPMVSQPPGRQQLLAQNMQNNAPSSVQAQTEQNGVDWQGEAYQKIQAMKEAHFAELQDFHLKISLKVQQPDLTPHAKQSENYEKLKSFKQMLDRLVAFLQISKNNITPSLNDKLSHYEKQLINMLASNRRQKVMPSQQQGQQQFQHPVGQQQFQHPVGHSQSAPQHQPSQVMQAQQQDNNGNQAQQMNMSSAVPSSMQHGAMTLSSLAAPVAHQNITNSVQVASDLDPGQVSSFGSLQQGSMGSVQQNGLSPLQNYNITNKVQAASDLDPVQVSSSGSLQQGSMGSVQQNGLSQNSLQQQSATTLQQSNLQTQQQQQQQQQHEQQQLLGQQANMLNIQQNQLLGQQNNILDIKPQQQQQQRLPAQQNNLVSLQQSQQSLNQQSMSLHQQQQPQSQQQQLLGSLQNVSNMQLLQQSKNMSQTQQQLQQPSMVLMQPQGQQSHLLSSQHQLMPQFQSQPGQLQQKLAMQQQPNSTQREMQQRLQLSGGLLQSQTAMEQQKSFIQSQRGIPEVSSSSIQGCFFMVHLTSGKRLWFYVVFVILVLNFFWLMGLKLLVNAMVKVSKH